MRQELFRIWLEHPWALTNTGPTGILTVGAGWLWLMIVAAQVLALVVLQDRERLRDKLSWTIRVAVLLALPFAGKLGLPATLPVFGYGAMVLAGFLAGLAFARWRAAAIGRNPDELIDLSFWLLISGIVGARIAFLAQYWNEVVRPGMNPAQALFAIINLSSGGLVLIGALVGGTLGFVAFCRYRKVSFFELADLIMPAVFIGVGFGRIGCLLNGCCFGERCDLPWGITFAAGTVPHMTLVERGLLDAQAAFTYPLHPTQIYSALDGFILATATGLYFWYRKHAGDVFALGCLLYSMSRFLMEFLRGDEPGQLGTILTISQFYSLGIFAVGLTVLLTGAWRKQLRQNTRQRAHQLAPSP